MLFHILNEHFIINAVQLAARKKKRDFAPCIPLELISTDTENDGAYYTLYEYRPEYNNVRLVMLADPVNTST